MNRFEVEETKDGNRIVRRRDGSGMECKMDVTDQEGNPAGTAAVDHTGDADDAFRPDAIHG